MRDQAAGRLNTIVAKTWHVQVGRKAVLARASQRLRLAQSFAVDIAEACTVCVGIIMKFGVGHSLLHACMIA